MGLSDRSEQFLSFVFGHVTQNFYVRLKRHRSKDLQDFVRSQARIRVLTAPASPGPPFSLERISAPLIEGADQIRVEIHAKARAS